MLSDWFSVQVFFLVFRETLETAVIVSVLLTFLSQGFGVQSKLSPEHRKIYESMRRQVWIGTFLGILVCIVIGSIFLILFYTVGTNLWDRTEKLWESIFSIVAAIIITKMGLAMLRLNKMQDKWRLKLAQAIVDTSGEEYFEEEEQQNNSGSILTYIPRCVRFISRKYSMAVLPMVTTMREGLEAVMFLGGLGASTPGSSFPLAVIAALALGSAIGFAMYRSGGTVSIKIFMLTSTCFLYLVAAGLFSRGVWFFEMHQFITKVGADVSESGNGPGSYDITRSVWHVNCCNPETDGLWMVFGALLGWQNSATYGSVISYNLYWIFVMCMILRIQYRESLAKREISEDEQSLINRAANVIAES